MAAVPGMIPRRSAPKTGGSEAPVQRGPHTSPNHPDGRTKDPYTDPRNPSTGGSGGGQDKHGNPVPKKATPGPGATGTGGGRDTPGAGKDRGQFEQDRQRDRGTGKDRPPIYRPPVHEPGGYQSKKIPPLSPAGRVLKGSSAVHGMLPRY